MTLRVRPSRRAAATALATAGALSLAVAGCTGAEAPGDDACAAAAAHLAACFPDQPRPDECHAPSAAALAATPCDALAAADAKADGGWLCLWMPWLCLSGGGEAGATTRAVSVSVERCARSIFATDDCQGVYAAACSLVVLEDTDGGEVARAYSSLHGSVRFEGVGPEAHRVRVLDRAGQTTRMVVGDFASSVVPAEAVVREGRDDVRLNVYLPSDSEAEVAACSTLTGYLDVYDTAGDRLDAEEIEWGWLVRFLGEDGTEGLTRPLRLHPEASGTGQWENVFTFHRVFPGTHVVELVRMDVPSWSRRNNPDYERLLRLYAVRGAEPVVLPIVVGPEDVPEPLTLRHRLEP